MPHTDIKHVLPNLSGAVVSLRVRGQTSRIDNEDDPLKSFSQIGISAIFNIDQNTFLCKVSVSTFLKMA